MRVIYLNSCSFRIMQQRKICQALETEEKFCVKTALKTLMEEVKNIKSALNLLSHADLPWIDKTKDSHENLFDE